MVPSLLLLSCESSVSVKENSDKKKGEKTGLNRYVYDFSMDYSNAAVDDIIWYSQLFNEKEWHSIIKCLGF